VSLQVRGLSVDIAGRRIVSEVDIAVPDGAFVGLLGPNGSGKSTILRAIYRVHRPAAGAVWLDGSDLLALRPQDAARRVAVVAQESTVEFDLTVLYGSPTAAQKEQFLQTSPITKNLRAVKNHCFLALSYDEVTPGPRNAQAVTAIAHWLHPSAFGLPADGS
jgi:ABC-type cobalamin/Fe3+-siderophores transport system ATPase subunit